MITEPIHFRSIEKIKTNLALTWRNLKHPHIACIQVVHIYNINYNILNYNLKPIRQKWNVGERLLIDLFYEETNFEMKQYFIGISFFYSRDIISKIATNIYTYKCITSQ